MVRGVNGNGEESIYACSGLGALMEQTWIIAKNGYGYHNVSANPDDLEPDVSGLPNPDPDTDPGINDIIDGHRAVEYYYAVPEGFPETVARLLISIWPDNGSSIKNYIEAGQALGAVGGASRFVSKSGLRIRPRGDQGPCRNIKGP